MATDGSAVIPDREEVIERAERALRQTEQHLRDVLAHAPVILFAIDRDGIVQLSEGGGLRALGVSPGQNVGRSVFELYGHLPETVDALRRAIGGEEFSQSGEFSGRWYETHFTPLRDAAGLPAGVIGVSADVTEQRNARAEAERAARDAEFLAEASRQLAASLDYETAVQATAAVAVPYLADWCIVDLVADDGTIERAAVAHADPARREVARRIESVRPERDAPEGIPKALRTGRPVVYADLTDAELSLPEPRVGTHDPGLLAAIRAMGLRSYMCVPLIAHGRTVGALTFCSAGDGRRYGAHELALGEDLARRAALAVDAARLHRQALEAIQARDEFLSIASHELRTPLTSVHLALQNALRLLEPANARPPARRDAQAPSEAGAQPDQAPPSPAQVVAVMEVGRRQARRLERLIGMLLDVSRIRAGAVELERRDVDLAALAREVAEDAREEVAQAACTLAVHAPAPVVGRWDGARLEQVVTNLLGNAIKYGAGGPVELSVTGDADTARLVMRDRGIGIAPDRLARVFERFERAVSSSHYGGLGLGLYIVRRIVDAHGGAVRVDSVEGVGSTFTVDLPRQG